LNSDNHGLAYEFPFCAAYILFIPAYDLTPAAYIASEVFTALTIHMTCTVVYNKYSPSGFTDLYYGLFIGIAMIPGSMTVKKIIDKNVKSVVSYNLPHTYNYYLIPELII